VLGHIGEKGRLSLQRIAHLLTYSPAEIFNIQDKKGSLDVGKDADITLVDLDLVKTVIPSELGSFSDYSLYEGQSFKGWPVQTILRGKKVMENGKITGSAGGGEYLFRKSA
jgi:dihydropyrimidinase